MSEEIEQQDSETLTKIQAMLDERIEEKQKETAQQPAEQESVRLETPRNTSFDQSNFTQGALYAWSMMTPELSVVQVTDHEKALYLKAVLNDVPVIIPIELEMGDNVFGNLTVELRTLNNYETDVVFLALEKDKEEGMIKGHHQLATRIQQYAAALQLLKVQGKPVKQIAFPEPGDAHEDMIKLRAHVHKQVGAMQWPRWQAVLSALRVFETKIKICNDAALNGNFWTPQGADS